MNSLYEEAAHFERFFRSRNWQFCFIGGLAVQRWGLPRLTLDLDVSLLTGWDNTEPYVNELLLHFPSRIADAAEFARANRVLLLQSPNGLPTDVSLAALPFEAAAITRASTWQISPDIALTTCSAEDLIVYKAFANRQRDWDDISGVLQRQGPRLDASRVLSDLSPLCEARGSYEPLTRLRELFTTLRHDQ